MLDPDDDHECGNEASGEGNIHGIYQHLLQGNTLEFSFRSKEECESFRLRLAKLKSSQDKIIRDLGLEEDQQKLSCKIQPSLNPADNALGAGYILTVCLQSKEQATRWKFKIVSKGAESNAPQAENGSRESFQATEASRQSSITEPSLPGLK